MEINGRPVPVVTVELNIAGNGPAGILIKKETGTFVDSLTRKGKVEPPPGTRADGKGSLVDIVA